MHSGVIQLFDHTAEIAHKALMNTDSLILAYRMYFRSVAFAQ